MCAIEAGKRGRRVAVLEHADRLGKKILISGGGRCNFTNLHCQSGKFPLVQSTFRQVGARPLHPRGFHRAGRTASHPVSRENAGTTLLRPLRPRHSRHARSRMPRRQRERLPEHKDSGSQPRHGVHRSQRERRIPRTRISSRHRRPVNPEDRRDFLRLRPGPTVRLENPRTLARTRASRVRCRRPLPLLRPRRRFRRSDRLVRRSAVP